MLTFNEKAGIIASHRAPHMDSSKDCCLHDARIAYAKGDYATAMRRLDRGADYVFGRSYRPEGWVRTAAQIVTQTALEGMAPGEVRVVSGILVFCDPGYKFIVGHSTVVNTLDESVEIDLAVIEIVKRAEVL